ncbi:uncharacterized protein [Clytia hemisphaerica]|uniref:uncharacterized protein n=1 Tax=Clytia hemisphaerica TaxID=252671 RepID=UPI0034D4DAD5
MSGETHQILLVFIFLFSSCSFGLFTLSTVGSKWFACRSAQHVTQRRGRTPYDLIFTLWEYCERTPTDDYKCAKIDGAEQFKDVFLDFKILRVLAVSCMVASGLLVLLCLSLCLLQQRKIFRRVVILQCVIASFTVVFGISSLVYAAARGQDIVGLEVQFTFGWSCVSSWIATIIAFLNAIMTLVMICVYLDRLNERVIQVRFDLGMDNLSIRSNSLRRINEDLDMLESGPSHSEQNERNTNQENDTDIGIVGQKTELDGESKTIKPAHSTNEENDRKSPHDIHISAGTELNESKTVKPILEPLTSTSEQSGVDISEVENRPENIGITAETESIEPN